MTTRCPSPTTVRAFLGRPSSSWARDASRFRTWVNAYPGGLADGTSWVQAVATMSPPGETRSIRLRFLCDTFASYAWSPSDLDLLFDSLLVDASLPNGRRDERRRSLQEFHHALTNRGTQGRADHLLAKVLAEPSVAIDVLETILRHASANAPSQQPGRTCLQEAAARRLIGPAAASVIRWTEAGADWGVRTSEGQSLLHLVLGSTQDKDVLELSLAGVLVALAPLMPDDAWTTPDHSGVRACDQWAQWAASPRVQSVFSAIKQGPEWLARALLEAATPLDSPPRRPVARL